MADADQRSEARLGVTLDAGYHRRLRVIAERDHRSLASQMRVYLERCIDQDEPDASPAKAAA